MNAVHFLCHLDGPRPRNSYETGTPGELKLGWWKMSADQAESLVGGWAYLHEKSSDVAYAAYRIRGVVPGDGEWAGRYALIMTKAPSIGGVRWRGEKASQNPVHNFRIVVDATLPHET